MKNITLANNINIYKTYNKNHKKILKDLKEFCKINNYSEKDFYTPMCLFNPYKNKDNVLKSFYQDTINEFLNFKKITKKFIINTFWINVIVKNVSYGIHNHSDYDFSLVHYLKFNTKDHTGTTFYKDEKKNNPCDVEVECADVVIFDGKINHEALPHNSENIRITSVINFGLI
jgi:hypothetical protein